MTAIITALTTVEGALWGLIALLTWVFREGFFAPSPPYLVADNTRLAIGLTALAVLQLVAAVTYLISTEGFGWWFVTAVQAPRTLRSSRSNGRSTLRGIRLQWRSIRPGAWPARLQCCFWSH